MCGRLIEQEDFPKDPFDEDEEEEIRQKKRSLQVCQLCQAKLKHEADESQKVPKPM